MKLTVNEVQSSKFGNTNCSCGKRNNFIDSAVADSCNSAYYATIFDQSRATVEPFMPVSGESDDDP
jgi:hypothetical protein